MYVIMTATDSASVLCSLGASDLTRSSNSFTYASQSAEHGAMVGSIDVGGTSVHPGFVVAQGPHVAGS